MSTSQAERDCVTRYWKADKQQYELQDSRELGSPESQGSHLSVLSLSQGTCQLQVTAEKLSKALAASKTCRQEKLEF